ncbi:MAG: GNAT family N-acetyltransferase [Agriterribacter sp.]
MSTTTALFTEADIEAGLSLCRSNAWNQVESDWRLLLNVSAAGCRVIKHEDQVIGSVSTISYNHFFSWVGMLLVDPAFQRRGIGTQLLNTALEILSKEETIKLDATPAGRELYLQLNFTDEYTLMRMQAATPLIAEADNRLVKPMNENFLSLISETDQLVFGADRKLLLQGFRDGAPEYAMVVEEKGKIVGYCLGRKGYSFDQIGPVIADDIAIAKHLATAAFRNVKGKPVIIDALLHNEDWVHWLKKMGFTDQRPFIRMYKGLNRHPGEPRKQYAIAGPEFG